MGNCFSTEVQLPLPEHESISITYGSQVRGGARSPNQPAKLYHIIRVHFELGAFECHFHCKRSCVKVCQCHYMVQELKIKIEQATGIAYSKQVLTMKIPGEPQRATLKNDRADLTRYWSKMIWLEQLGQSGQPVPVKELACCRTPYQAEYPGAIPTERDDATEIV